MFLVMLLGGSAFELENHTMRFRHTWAHFVSGIGSTIMGIALMIGMLVTPYAEDAFACLGENTDLRCIFSKFLGRQTIDLTFN